MHWLEDEVQLEMNRAEEVLLFEIELPCNFVGKANVMLCRGCRS